VEGFPSRYVVENRRNKSHHTSSLYYGTYKQFLRMSYGSGYGGGSRGFTGPKPVEVGKEYDVEVTEISRQGDGIARVQGFVVFVKNGKPGQKVKIKVNQVGNRFATATILTQAT
jgi:predicted RNA-binding protein with TRAM domain